MTQTLLTDTEVIERVFDHIDHQSTDLGDDIWREPTDNYRSQVRFAAEIALLKRMPVPFCPSAALTEPGSYVARTAAGTPLVAVRGEDGAVRAFRNACRHRGMQVAEGSGCTKAFVCRYHGWAYRLDGRLQYIPHDHGFPNLNKEDHGLVPVVAQERNGLVFITQDAPVSDGALNTLPEIITPDQRVFGSFERTDDINWKLNAEAALEGYHIKPTHRETFYPYGFDNLNVVETFGPNSRVTYPFRRIEKLRNVQPQNRRIDGMVTYTYQIFPNVIIANLSNHTTVTMSEPESPSRTRFITYRLTNRGEADNDANLARAQRDAEFVANEGGQEDIDVVRAIQAGLASNANEHFTYGRFEKAIGHFHRTLTETLQLLD